MANDRFLIRKRTFCATASNDGTWPLADVGREKVDGLPECPLPTLSRHRGEIGRVSAVGDITDDFACFFETYMGKVLQGENARQNA